jgi:hypothetical protein
LDHLGHSLVERRVVVDGGGGDVGHKVGVKGRQVAADGKGRRLVDVAKRGELVGEGLPVTTMGAEVRLEEADSELRCRGGRRACEASAQHLECLSARRRPPLWNVVRGVGVGAKVMVGVSKDTGHVVLLLHADAAGEGLADCHLVGVVLVLLLLGVGEVVVLAGWRVSEVGPERLGVGNLRVHGLERDTHDGCVHDEVGVAGKSKRLAVAGVDSRHLEKWA